MSLSDFCDLLFRKVLLCGLSAALLLGCGAAWAQSDPVETGRYLATAGDCVSCHTRPGGDAFAGGLSLETPFGTIHTANITPDPETGIGNWSEAQFMRAMHEGISADGHNLYPAFPYPEYTKISDDDVRALYAYLRTLKPVKYKPPANEMRFPFGIRSLVAIWNRLFFTPGRFVPDPAKSADWNRGAYLVEGPGHCGACHTPRNALGGEKQELTLTGGSYDDPIVDKVLDDRIVPADPDTVRTWGSSNLTPSSSGLGAWSAEDITAYLKTGHSTRAGAFGPMSQVVTNSTQHLSDADLRAIAVYLKGLGPKVQEMAEIPKDRITQGEIIYTGRCGICHQPTGLGIPQVPGGDLTKSAPPLAGSSVVQAPDPATLINVILYGAHEAKPLPGSWPHMNGFEQAVGLDEDQIAVLADYLRSAWGNKAGPVDPDTVARQY